MRILLLNALDIYGGGEFFVYQFAELLKRRGHWVWVSCREDNLIYEKCRASGIDVFPLDYPKNNKKGKLVKNVNALKKFIKENKIDIVHSNTNYDRTAGAFAAKAAGVPHVTTNHSFHSIEYNPTHWLRNKRLTDHFIVDGECTKELLMKRDKIKNDRISLIHLGIEPESMKRDEKLRKKIRKEFGIKDKDIVIGNVARMVEMKGQEYLIKAFQQVSGKFPDATLMIAGSGKLERNLHKLVQSLDINDYVIFTGFRDDMQAVYSSFDIYAHTSVEGGGETFPYAVLYALAQELPVVVSRVGDVPVMVVEEINGFVVPDKNPEAIAKKLTILLDNKDMREKMGRASLNHLKRNFTVEKMVEEIEKVYYKVSAHTNKK